MAISATYLQLQQSIADELGNRTDLLSPLSDSGLTDSPIKKAIQSAIAKWERENFYFNESYDSPLFTTVAGQEFYTTADAAGIVSSPNIASLHILISATRMPLYLRPWEYLEGLSISPASRGQPQDWAYFGQQLRLYPIPDGAYPVRASRTTRIAALSADGDTNVWTTDAYDLIRSEAKLILAGEVLHDDDMASRMVAAIHGPQGYLYSLKAETARRGLSRIKPTQF